MKSLIEIEYNAELDFSKATLEKYGDIIVDIFNEPDNIEKYINTDDNEIKIIIALYYLSNFNKKFDEKCGIDMLLDLHNKNITKASVNLGVYYKNKDEELSKKYILSAVEQNDALGLSNLSYYYYTINNKELFLKYMNELYKIDPNYESYYINMALYKKYIEKNDKEYELYIHKGIISFNHIAYYIYSTIAPTIDMKIQYIINAIKIKITKKYIELLKKFTTLNQRTILLLTKTNYDKPLLIKLDDNIIDTNINIINTNNKCPICMNNTDNILIKFSCYHSLCIKCSSIKYNCLICNTVETK